MNCAQLKMVNETVPNWLYPTYGTGNTILLSTGYLLLFSLGSFLPREDYNPSIPHNIPGTLNYLAYTQNQNDEFWRVIFIFPIIFNIFMITVFSLFIKEDSIMFNISAGEDEKALNLIRKVYDKDEDHKHILSHLKK